MPDAMPVKNNIAELREAADLTQRALGALLATSARQIARHEQGEQISPAMALAMARVLGQPLNSIFPEIGDAPPKSEKEWKRLGFDLLAPLPTWQLNIHLRGIDEPFAYLVDSADCLRLNDLLDGRYSMDFITFDSCGRSIYVNAERVQRISVVEDGAALLSPPDHSLGQLEPHFASFRAFFADRRTPWVIPALDMEEYDIGHAFEALEGAIDVKDEFLSFYDAELDLVHVRIGEIILAELPTFELLGEMGMLGSDFWQTADAAAVA
jgi:transcriptional regulator with XRE-family HTH domain